jgi:hypothetical protein
MPRLVKRPRLSQILEFCAEDPIERVFLADVARRGLGRFAALRDGGRIVAICHVGANLVPSGEGTDAFADLAARAGARMLVGEETAVSELWEAAREHLPEPLEDRPGQPVYVLEEAPAPGESNLRPARMEDLGSLVRASAAAYLEEVGVDAYRRDPALFEWRTRVQIEEGRSWLWAEGGRILFKAEASAWTDQAVQLQQVWVEPDLRPQNSPAIRLYERIGMRRTISYRSLIFG